MAAGDHLQAFDIVTVAGHPAVILAIGPHQLGEHKCITRVGLRA